MAVTIVGAGLAGLTLGRYLAKQGIKSVIYDRSSQGPRHSYGITLYASTYRPLLALLGLEEQSFRQRVSVLGTEDTTSQSSDLRANRWKLEELLRQDLDIRYDHKVASLDNSGTQKRLKFENGQTVEHESLIGGDGVHSPLRKTILPDSDPKVLPYVAINGKRRVPTAKFQELYAPHMIDKVELKQGDTLLQVSVNDKSAEKVSISWVYYRPSRGSGDPLYQPNRPKSGASDIPDQFFEEAAALHGLPQPFQDIFASESLRSDRLLSWLMRSVEIGPSGVQKLSASGVFLLGDALHAQPIIGGEGANVAINDALALGEQIAQHGASSIPRWYNDQYARQGKL